MTSRNWRSLQSSLNKDWLEMVVGVRGALFELRRRKVFKCIPLLLHSCSRQEAFGGAAPLFQLLHCVSHTRVAINRTRLEYQMSKYAIGYIHLEESTVTICCAPCLQDSNPARATGMQPLVPVILSCLPTGA